MANILYLVHRLPFPPNKGDKVRSYHLLKHLAAKHRVFLGTFVDDPEDEVHIDTVRRLCADLHVSRLNPITAKVRSLRALIDGRPLSLAYYADSAMRKWVTQTRANSQIDAVVVFSSAMGQYASPLGGAVDCPVLIDFVDVDSTKWSQYASNHRWPLSWIYAREGRRLLQYERALASHARRSFFVTDNEVALFMGLAPELEGAVEAVGNGVDSDFFSPSPDCATPYLSDELPVVFTGAMDYWPNIDAATWFAQDMMPTLRRGNDRIRFYIVGRSPTPAIRALSSDHVVVTGTVADVRPYLQYAAAVVAPMRIARGVQNKVLEAMSMGRPVIAARECVDAISAVDGEELLAAQSPSEFVDAVQTLLSGPDTADRMGAAGRACVVRRFSWDAHLSGIDRYLPAGSNNTSTSGLSHVQV